MEVDTARSIIASDSISRQRGFTLIELVLVVVIIGALSAAVSVRMGGVAETKLPMRVEAFAAELQHVQSLAISWNKSLRIVVAADGFSVSCMTAEAVSPCNQSPVKDPATQRPFAYVAGENVTVTGTDLELDSWGRPRDPATSTLITADHVYTLSAGVLSEKVVIKPVTGFVVPRAP